MDEPESMGALTMPVREGLDNLISSSTAPAAARWREKRIQREPPQYLDDFQPGAEEGCLKLLK